jgi:hypothetical protein
MFRRETWAFRPAMISRSEREITPLFAAPLHFRVPHPFTQFVKGA